MPAFKRFGPGDQIDNVLILHPVYDLVSGSEGWRGSPEGSSSLSLYGGARRRPGVFQSVEYQSFAPNVSQTGNPRRGQPMTSSISFAYMTKENINFSQITPVRLGREHWDVMQRLMDDYRVISSEYVTASYDYYCVYFRGTSLNRVSTIPTDASGDIIITGSFTLESWIKPFATSSVDSTFTIQSLGSLFDRVTFGITGSTGRLFMTSSNGSSTASIGPQARKWSHVAAVFDASTHTGTFYVNLNPVGTFALSSLNLGDSVYSYGSVSDGDIGTNGVAKTSFDGLMGESRTWNTARTHVQLSSSYSRHLQATEMSGCAVCLRLNEGPLFRGIFSPLDNVLGSGSINYAAVARESDGTSVPFAGFNDRVGPVWHPNDNIAFFPPRQHVEDSLFPFPGSNGLRPIVDPVTRMLVVDVPSAFYGRQIVPGSVRMVCRAFESFGFIRTIVDDGRGGLYLSGSVCSSSLADREEYAGVGWNKVGNVFYGEGLVVIKDPSLLDFGRTDGAALVPTDTFALSFKGDSRVPVKTLMCRVDHGEFNCTTNPTFATTGSAGERLRRHASGSIRATTVGIYNSDRELVAVARLADPVRIRARDRINIRIRLDF